MYKQESVLDFVKSAQGGADESTSFQAFEEKHKPLRVAQRALENVRTGDKSGPKGRVVVDLDKERARRKKIQALTATD